MELVVLRYNISPDSTNGMLLEKTWIGYDFLCYTLEDEERAVKVKHETMIPYGRYEIKLRREGGFHNKYSKRFPDIHDGMLHITNVPNFEYILIHCGNTDEHTSGCLLVGDSQENNSLVTGGFIGKSTQAYKRIYKPICEALQKGEEVFIEYKHINDFMDI
jgi:hypothetical protein|tara:strand:+ start:154 stop:636 length:483 start_codon:yes stop_codon:yes gene_type:complete